MDKAIVRFSVIAINLYFLYNLVFAFQGEDTPIADGLFSQSLLSAIILVVLAFSQGKYHCKWMQALTVNILLTVSLNILATKFGVITDVLFYFIAISASWGISTILAFYFAISHFIKVQKLKRKLLKQHSQANGNTNARSESED